MLLAVDVGNTQTHVGVFEGSRLSGDWRLATRGSATADELALATAGALDFRALGIGDLTGMIVSTVVPRLASEYEQMAERHLGIECLLVGPAVRTGMPIRIDNPHELGPDRLVNAVAAYERFGGACLSVDFGTSINIDAVSGGGEYLGGALAPGIEVSMEALSARAARLPRIRLEEPRAAIGTNTQSALQSGFVYGFAALVDGLIERMANEVSSTGVVATGGMASSIGPLCGGVDEVDSYLTLKGLRLIWERNR